MFSRFAARTHEVYRHPTSANDGIPDLSDFETLDDAHLLALVETLRPIIYSHISVLINMATPRVTKDLRPFAEGEADSLADLEKVMAEHYQMAVYEIGDMPEMSTLREATDDMLCVLRLARIKGLYDPIEATAETPRTLELTQRGCRTGLLVAVRSVDYLYTSIREDTFVADPYHLSENSDVMNVIMTTAMGIAKRVGVQDLSGLMRLLGEDADPFSGINSTRFASLPTELHSPYRLRLKTLIDKIRTRRSEINTNDSFDAYLLDHLMCPAIVGVGDVNPIPDLVSWVVHNADQLRAFDLAPLPSNKLQ